MNGKFLLDTNIIIALFRKDIAAQSEILEDENTYIPDIVIGELYYGAFKSSRSIENVSLIDTFVDKINILGLNPGIAKEYGNIKNTLRRKGRPIPDNDIWIAAIAKHYTLTLVTRDEHFKEVEELSLESW